MVTEEDIIWPHLRLVCVYTSDLGVDKKPHMPTSHTTHGVDLHTLGVEGSGLPKVKVWAFSQKVRYTIIRCFARCGQVIKHRGKGVEASENTVVVVFLGCFPKKSLRAEILRCFTGIYMYSLKANYHI